MAEEKTLPIFGEIDQQLAESGAIPKPGGLAEAAQAAGAEVKVTEVEVELAPDHGKETQLSRAIVNVLPGLDPAVIAIREKVRKLLIYSQERAVATMPDAESATNDLSIIGELKKALKGKREEYLEPLQDYQKSIRDVFDSIGIPLDEAQKITKDKVLAFKQEQGRLWVEAENAARLQREADEAARKVLEATGEIVPEQEEAPVIIPDEVSKHVHADLGTAGVTKNWKWEVVDFALLPDDYKVADGSLLTAIARKHHDQKPVPGVRFYGVEGLSVRQRGGQNQ